MARLRGNFLSGTLNTTLLVGDTTINGSNISSLPVIVAGNEDGDYMALTINPDGTGGGTPEIVHVTEHTSGSTTATILRAQEGTSASEHASGVVWRNAATADDYSGEITVPAWIQDLHTPLGDGPEGNPVFDDSFNADAMDASWVEVVPSGTCEWTQRRGKISSFFHSQGSSVACAILYPYAIPVGHAIETRMTVNGPPGNHLMAGPIVTDGTTTTSGSVWLMPYVNYFSLRAGTLSSHGTTLLNSGWNVFEETPAWMRLEHESANSWRCAYSPDGISWSYFGPYSYTLTPSHIGFGVGNWGTGSTPRMASFDYIRVYEVV